MIKFLTRVIAAGVLMVFFPAHGDTTNTVFYADFNAASDKEPMDTSDDLNDATDPSLRAGVWSLTADHTARNSIFAAGEASQGIVLYLDLQAKTSGQVLGALNEPSLFRAPGVITQFDFDFKPNTSTATYRHIITVTDSKFNPVFTVDLSADPGDAYMVKVNGVSIGSAFRSSNSALKLNNLSLTVSSAGISATLTRGDNGVKTTVPNIAVASSAATGISNFSIQANLAKNIRFEYDNFKVYQIIKQAPAPRLDLYIISP